MRTPEATMKHEPFAHHCPGCPAAVTRRRFLYGVGAATVGGVALSALDLRASDDGGLPRRGPLPRRPLRVQPVLTYEVPQRREATSWRPWGGIHTDADASQERARIEGELGEMAWAADFPLEILPVQAVKAVEPAARLAAGDHDVTMIFAAGGWLDILEALSAKDKWSLMFLRHDPGPAYLWYEIVHPRFLRKTMDEYGQPGWDVDDVVVDRYAEVLWRLRALGGLKSTLGKKVVCIGGAAGWGEGGRVAPERARQLWKMDLVDWSYDDLGPRIGDALKRAGLVKACAAAADRYLGARGVELATTREFVTNAFVLNEVFKDVMGEAGTDAITVNECMGTIMGMSRTTACMPLSLLNDDGYLAFCESDFVVIPSGVLLHHLRPAGVPQRSHLPPRQHRHPGALHRAAKDGRQEARAGEDPHALRVGLRGRAQGRHEGRAGLHEPRAGLREQEVGGLRGHHRRQPLPRHLPVADRREDPRRLRRARGGDEGLPLDDVLRNYLRECGYALKKTGVGFLNVSRS
jgi:hypothetical protein